MKLVLEGDPLSVSLQQTTRRASQIVKKRMSEAASEAQQEITDQGRQDIESAGNFGSRWTDGLNVDLEEEENKITLTVTMAVPYWSVFQTGKVIEGKPLLWIPLSSAGIEPGTKASDFPGRLFRVDRKSGAAPLLFSVDDKQPKYFGKDSVTLPKKFHLIEICKDVGSKLPELYRTASGNVVS